MGKPKTTPDFSLQTALVTEFMPPGLGMSSPENQAELAELVTVLGDEHANIRWLAGSSLAKISGLAVVNLLAVYLQSNPGEMARQESLKGCRRRRGRCWCSGEIDPI